jgi:hypothetical protein
MDEDVQCVIGTDGSQQCLFSTYMDTNISSPLLVLTPRINYRLFLGPLESFQRPRLVDPTPFADTPLTLRPSGNVLAA